MPGSSHPSGPPDPEAPRAATLAGDVPLPRTALIGREADVERTLALLRRDDVPVVTITGPGGVGKTRLALEVAADLGAAFPDGAAVVLLASVRDPRHVLDAVAEALSLPEVRGQDLPTRLRTYLRDRQLLLVLDNVEHLLDAVPSLAGVLSRCPGVTVLATSRSPLGISGEWVFPLDVLTPDAARALFTTRAQAANPDAAPGNDVIPTIDAICDRLDRLPLAIELAAARARVLPPHALLARLDRRLHLLTGGPRDAHPRQRTMAATIAWSHDLLAEPERLLFRRLGAFVGGFTLEAATFVARDAAATLDTLSALVAASLVTPVAGMDGKPRFTMLETIREFAVDLLAASGDEAAARDAHAAWCLDLLERAALYLGTSDASAWLDRLEAEHDNLRAALAWSSEPSRRATALRLIQHISPFWHLHSHYTEGTAWSDRAVAWTEGERTPARVGALDRAAHFTVVAGDPRAAMALYAESIALAREIEGIDDRQIAWSLVGRGVAAAELEEFHAAQAAFEEALAIFRRLDDGSTGSLAAIANTMVEMSRVARSLGDWDRMIPLAEEAVAILRQIGDGSGADGPMFLLATAAEHFGEDARAASLYHEALHLIADSGDLRAMALAFTGIMFLAAKAGRPGEAGRLFGARELLYERIGIRVDTYNQQRVKQTVGMALTRMMDEDAFRACVAEGRDLPVEQAFAEALELSASLAATPPQPAPAPFGLTPREVEVLRLVTDGRSNRSIAEALSISERTVEVHVLHIMTKLGVESRAAIAAHAVRHGLA